MLTVAYRAFHLSLGQGDADYTAVHRAPLHNDCFENSGGEDAMIRVGPTYTEAMQGYLIDIATAEAHGITDLMQMQDPEIAALFDTDGDGAIGKAHSGVPKGVCARPPGHVVAKVVKCPGGRPDTSSAQPLHRTLRGKPASVRVAGSCPNGEFSICTIPTGVTMASSRVRF